MESLPQLEIRKTRTLSESLSITFSFFRENFPRLMKCLLLIAGPVVLLSAVVGVKSPTSAWYMLRASSIAGRQADSLLTIGSLLIGFLSFIVILGTINQFVVLYAARGRDGFTIEEVWQELRANMGTLITSMLGITVILFFSLVPMLIGMTLVARSLVLGGFLLLVACALPVYLMIVFSQIFIVRMEEQLDFMQGLRRCFELIKGRWWPTFGLIFIIYCIIGLLGLTVSVPLGFLAGMEAMHNISGGGKGWSLATVLIGALLSLVQSALWVLPTLAISLQYYSLAERVDGSGLLDRINAIGTEDAEGDNAQIL